MTLNLKWRSDNRGIFFGLREEICLLVRDKTLLSSWPRQIRFDFSGHLDWMTLKFSKNGKKIGREVKKSHQAKILWSLWIDLVFT